VTDFADVEADTGVAAEGMRTARVLPARYRGAVRVPSVRRGVGLHPGATAIAAAVAPYPNLHNSTFTAATRVTAASLAAAAASAAAAAASAAAASAAAAAAAAAPLAAAAATVAADANPPAAASLTAAAAAHHDDDNNDAAMRAALDTTAAAAAAAAPGVHNDARRRVGWAAEAEVGHTQEAGRPDDPADHDQDGRAYGWMEGVGPARHCSFKR